MLKESSLNIRQLFIKKFTKEIILTIKKQQREKELSEKREKDRKINIESAKLKEKLSKYFKEKPLIPSRLPPKQIITNQPRVPLTKQTTGQKFFHPHQIEQIPKTPLLPSSNKDELNLGKLTALLKDISITTIECPGPERRLMIRKANQIMTTQISLTSEEINNIIDEFAKKTRIPLVEGMLKARYKNIILNGINSNFGGSRFILIRKSPYDLIEVKESPLLKPEMPKKPFAQG